MIATIKAEWRKSRFRPAFLIGSGIIAAITSLAYASSWYLATHPGAGPRATSIATLYPDQVVNNVMGAAYPLGAALAIVLGTILSGSEYSWGTLKTSLTQGPGRLTLLAGRLTVFAALLAVLTAVLFAVGMPFSAVIAATQNHAIVWPTFADIAKGFGAIWLVFGVFGAIGFALGVVIRQSAAALGLGIVYLLAVEVIAVRFIDSLSNGDYKWVGDLFVGQNASALLAHLSGAATGVSIGVSQAILVIAVWLVGVVVVAAGLLRVRDVT
jgi:ABC-2 type transport system permease protein